ncbi:MAG TPA: hypothetical protein VGQ62_13875, partial [Chloroflexota bacterium]|nr:hypothetical protein [Chloroflexota bacterium]
FFRQRLKVRASSYGDAVPARDFPLLIDWFRSGQLQLGLLVSRTIPLDETASGFDDIARGETLRTVVVF